MEASFNPLCYSCVMTNYGCQLFLHQLILSLLCIPETGRMIGINGKQSHRYPSFALLGADLCMQGLIG